MNNISPTELYESYKEIMDPHFQQHPTVVEFAISYLQKLKILLDWDNFEKTIKKIFNKNDNSNKENEEKEQDKLKIRSIISGDGVLMLTILNVLIPCSKIVVEEEKDDNSRLVHNLKTYSKSFLKFFTFSTAMGKEGNQQANLLHIETLLNESSEERDECLFRLARSLVWMLKIAERYGVLFDNSKEPRLIKVKNMNNLGQLKRSIGKKADQEKKNIYKNIFYNEKILSKRLGEKKRQQTLIKQYNLESQQRIEELLTEILELDLNLDSNRIKSEICNLFEKKAREYNLREFLPLMYEIVTTGIDWEISKKDMGTIISNDNFFRKKKIKTSNSGSSSDSNFDEKKKEREIEKEKKEKRKGKGKGK